MPKYQQSTQGFAVLAIHVLYNSSGSALAAIWHWTYGPNIMTLGLNVAHRTEIDTVLTSMKAPMQLQVYLYLSAFYSFFIKKQNNQRAIVLRCIRHHTNK